MVRQVNIKEANRQAVLDVFMRQGICTKNELIAQTKLSSGTCTNMIALLLQEGCIIRIEDREGGHGRKAKQYQWVEENKYYIIVHKDKHIVVTQHGESCSLDEPHAYEAVICLGCYHEEEKKRLSDVYGVPVYFYNEAQAMLGYDLSQQSKPYASELCIYVDKNKNVKIAMAIQGQLVLGKNHRFGDLAQLELLTSTKTKVLISQTMQLMMALLDPDKILTCVRKKIDMDKLVSKLKTDEQPLIDHLTPTKKHLILGLLFLMRE